MKIPIKKDAQMLHIQFDSPIMEKAVVNEFNEFRMNLRMKIGAQVADLTNEAICTAIKEYAQKEGYSDLYLIDETFIKQAIIHEIQRRKGAHNEKIY